MSVTENPPNMSQLKTCCHPKVPATAPFLLLLDEMNRACVGFKNGRVCHGNQAAQRREARRDNSSAFCSPRSRARGFICGFLAGR